jgi:Domain of unknown function (DUF4111)
VTLPAPADTIVDAYLQAVDAEAPGLLEGLYLEGSVALGDFRPRTSDLDFVAVTAGPPDRAALSALARVHARLSARWRRPCFDGLYLTWAGLRDGPGRTGPYPRSREGRFHAATDGIASPVTWHTLAQSGVTCRGPAPRDAGIWTDARALAAWTDANLDRYWRRLTDRAARPLSPWGLTPYGTVWIVTGVSRLHHTMATGGIISKDGAARHALETFPAWWHRVAAEALRIRRADRARPAAPGLGEFLPIGRPARRSLYRTPLGRRRDVLAFTGMVIADAHRIHTGRRS